MTAPISDEQRQTFLDVLSRTGVIRPALEAAGFKRNCLPRLRSDPDFEAAYREALEDATDTMESEAYRRAVNGVLRTKAIGSGENTQFIDELHYSDPMLMFLLKANRPDRFADRSKSEISAPGGAPLIPATTDASAAARIAALLDEARRRRGEADDTEADDTDPFS